MATIIKYLDDHGLATLVKKIKQHTMNTYIIRGEAVFADANYVAKAAAGTEGYEPAINSEGVWQFISGTWTKIEEFEAGYVYNIVNNFQTTDQFVEGAGHDIVSGMNIVIVDQGSGDEHVWKWDMLASSFNLDPYQTKALITPIKAFESELRLTYAAAADLPTEQIYTESDDDGISERWIDNGNIAIIGPGNEEGDVYIASIEPAEDNKYNITWTKLGNQTTVEGAFELLSNVCPNTAITDKEIEALFS